VPTLPDGHVKTPLLVRCSAAMPSGRKSFRVPFSRFAICFAWTRMMRNDCVRIHPSSACFRRRKFGKSSPASTMLRPQLEHIIRAAAAITGAPEFVIVGSQALLGQFPEAPDELLVSIEADVFSLLGRKLRRLGRTAVSQVLPVQTLPRCHRDARAKKHRDFSEKCVALRNCRCMLAAWPEKRGCSLT